jgi:hypothetical protein
MSMGGAYACSVTSKGEGFPNFACVHAKAVSTFGSTRRPYHQKAGASGFRREVQRQQVLGLTKSGFSFPRRRSAGFRRCECGSGGEEKIDTVQNAPGVALRVGIHGLINYFRLRGARLVDGSTSRALRARAPKQAQARRRVVDEGVRSYPRAGCGKSACPVSKLTLTINQPKL